MELIKCENGHFYDLDKYETCPYCEKKDNSGKMSYLKSDGVPIYKATGNSVNEAVTVAMLPRTNEVELASTDRGINAGIAATDEPVTVAFFAANSGTAYITGWLVCVEGAEKGRDYRVCHGMNWVGRDADMDIYIKGDPEIALKKHCAIVYDDKSNQFFILDGDNSLTYLNDHLVKGSAILKQGDMIGIGKSRFEFVPFCREGHQWEGR